MTDEGSSGVMCPYNGILQRTEGAFSVRYKRILKHFGREIMVPVDKDLFVTSEMGLFCLCGYSVSVG